MAADLNNDTQVSVSELYDYAGKGENLDVSRTKQRHLIQKSQGKRI